MSDDDFRALALGFLDDDRERLDNDSDAESRCQRCTRLFISAADLLVLHIRNKDDVLFNASFDLHDALFGYKLSTATVSALLSSIEHLFGEYYARVPSSGSCQQFWDNAIGYASVGHIGESTQLFLDRALLLLSKLLLRPEAHIRASALHGLNHHPDMPRARAAIEEHLPIEGDPELRVYSLSVLEAFSRGSRLV